MPNRIIPLTGTETNRQAKTGDILTDEFHTTNDQYRAFIDNNLVAPEYHTAANTAARLALNSTASRGCWPFDICQQTDTGDFYLCISNNGAAGGDWVVVQAGAEAAVSDVSDGALPADGAIAGLSFSATPTQAECEALRDECENLRDVLANAITTIETLRDRCQANGVIS